MIVRNLYIDSYDWHVQIFYNITCSKKEEVMHSLSKINCPPSKLQEAYKNLSSCNPDTGLTYSNYQLRRSVLVTSRVTSFSEFINTFMHEIRHLVDHIAITDELKMGEEPVGYLTGEIGRALTKDILYIYHLKSDNHT